MPGETLSRMVQEQGNSWFVKDGCPDSEEIYCLQTVQAGEVRKLPKMRSRLQ